MLTGHISSQFESRAKPYQVPLATGEQSYGTFQFLGDPPSTGGSPTVVKFLKRSGYQRAFSGLTLNSPAFKAKWQELGKTDPLFGAAQYQYIAETHFYPLASYVTQKGLPRTQAIDEALFSMAVQHGKARKICDKAMATLDLKTATEIQIINALYNARSEYVEKLIERHVGRESDLTNLINTRYPKERAAVLALAQQTNIAESSFDKLFEQLGLSPEETRKAADDVASQGKFDPEQMSKKLSDMLAYYQKNQTPTTVPEPLDNGVDDPTDQDESLPSSSTPETSTSASSAELERIHEEDYRGISEFLNFLGDVAERTKIKGLGQTVGVIQHVMTAYQAVNKLVSLTGSIALGAVLNPISALGGAILGIISLFGSSGPSATEIILDQIQHLSEQIADMKAYLAEQFQEIFQQNQEILNIIQRGFFAITLEVQGQIGGLRTELLDRLDRISADILYIAKKNDIDHLELAFKDLRRYYSLADTLMRSKEVDIAGDPTVVIPTLAQDLFTWAVSEATNGLYTGRNSYEAAPPPDVFVGTGQPSLNILRVTLSGERGDSCAGEEILACSLIGYLASYYQHYRDPSSPERINVGRIPNPQLWHDVAQKYFLLKNSFLKYDKDHINDQPDEIKNTGLEFIQMINCIEGDSVFWHSLCHRYNELTKKLVTYQEAYVQAYTDSIRYHLDEEDKKSPYPIMSPPSWSFLQEPGHLIASMCLRNIRQITSFHNQVGAGARPILQALRTHILISHPLLALDYLQPVLELNYLQAGHFSAYQTSDIAKPYCINPIRDKNFDEVDAKLEARGGKRRDDHDHSRVYAKAGMEIFRRSEGSEERVTEWVLPVNVSISIGSETTDIATFTFRGSYAELAVETVFWDNPYVDGWRPGSHGGADRAIYKPQYSVSASGPTNYDYDLLAAIPGYIKLNLDQEVLRVHYDNVHALPVSRQEAIAQELIETYFIQQRKEIAKILKASEDNYGGPNATDRQKYYTLYKNTLLELDIHVRLIRLFSYLIGKDLNATFFKELITSTNIHNKLEQFEQHASITTPLLLMPKMIAAEQIILLPELDVSQARVLHHPRQLFEEICVMDEVCRKAKMIPSPLQSTTSITATLSSSSSSRTHVLMSSGELSPYPQTTLFGFSSTELPLSIGTPVLSEIPKDTARIVSDEQTALDTEPSHHETQSYRPPSP